jgi:hypothetical protein
MKLNTDRMSRRFSLLPVLAAVALATAGMSARAEPPTDLSKLVGTWNNVNTATGGLVRIQVSDAGTLLAVQAFGACTPTPCDLGVVNGLPQSLSVVSEVAEGFRATYNTGFSTIVISAQRIYDVNGGTFLRVTRHTNFAAGDTRSDYVSTEVFRR